MTLNLAGVSPLGDHFTQKHDKYTFMYPFLPIFCVGEELVFGGRPALEQFLMIAETKRDMDLVANLAHDKLSNRSSDSIAQRVNTK
jgi:hypothetical protein